MKRLLIAAAFLTLILSGRVSAEERILLFNSSISVNHDALITVSESITVQVEGDKIKRGIFRDIPTRYKYEKGPRRISKLSVLEVKMDGQPEPWFKKEISQGERIYIGQKDVMVTRGLHTYTITYTMDRQIGFFDDHDELYWNVTGNGWSFPIDKVRANISLPGSIAPTLSEGYTGAYGSKERAYETALTDDGSQAFETTRPLKPREGLTIVVGWPKGIVKAPDMRAKTAYFVTDYNEVLVAAAGIAVVFLYYFIVWLLAGRDPQKGIVMTRYKPPWDLSPAAMRYIYHNSRFDDTTMASALVSLAVKGWLKISKQDNEYSLTFNSQGEALKPSESVLLKAFRKKGSTTLILSRENHLILGAAKKAMKSVLNAEFGTRLFLNNMAYFVPGPVLSILFVTWYMLFPFRRPDALIAGMVLGLGVPFVVLVCGAFGLTVFEPLLLLVSYLSGKSSLFRKTVRAIGIVLFGALTVLICIILFAIHTGFALLVVSLSMTGLLFYRLIKAPTKLGRRALDYIEGFRRYLETAEGDRLNRMYPPERTPELFEKYLPYAMALGVEQKWAGHFEHVLAGAERAPVSSLAWYGGGIRTAGISELAGLSEALTLGIAHASKAPASSWTGGSGVRSGSSGSGGGGFSGGGGGGGGGGGW
jgi:uncharacterized membrane protein YgcG